MLSAWAAEGFSPAEFWQQTEATYVAVMTGRQHYNQAQIERDMRLAWHTAIFTRAEKLENLEVYLARMKPAAEKAKMTLDDITSRWAALEMAGYGITVTDLSEEGIK